MSSTDEIRSLEARHILPLYRRAPVAFSRGSGARLYDVEGREYLDLISGVGVTALGHGHKALAEAVAEQAETLLHCSNLFFHPLQGILAARLAALSGLPRAFFCNSGTEAVEACLKFARRYWHTRKDTERVQIVALQGSFHGRTMGSLSLTWDPHYRTPFAPLLDGVTFVPPTDPEALLRVVSPATSAIIIEPIQGEGGVWPLSKTFADAIAQACSQTGALLIIDEVQCGLGRTGVPFFFSTLGLRPDLLAVGKALGAGVPMGAALISEEVAGTIAFGDHGSTFGGNLLACRAALCFLDELLKNGLLEHVRQAGAHLETGLRTLARQHPAVQQIRGAGLMWGLELSGDATPVVEAALRRGLLINRTAETVVRLLPPLTISTGDLDEALTRLDAALAEAMVKVA